MKKIISIMISICMLLTNLPVIAYAENDSSEISLEKFTEQAVEILNSDDPNSVTYEEEVSKRVIVKSSKKIDTRNATDTASGYKDYYILEFPSAQSAQDAVDYYNTLDYVSFAQIDNIVSTTTIVTPEDSASDTQKHLSYNSETAGFTQLEKYNEDNSITYSEKITVAVLDTGVEDTHEFLQGRVEPTEYNFSSSGNENSSLDDDGHGTHVAGIIVDNTPENVIIRPYKVLNNEGKGTTLGALLGVEQAIADNVDIINMSLSAKGYDEALHNAVRDAYQKNIPVVVSSGNDGVTNLNVIQYSPASFEECITVGTSGEKSGIYWGIPGYCNRGDVVDIYAPGDNIKSSYLHNTYETLSGTSMSAPLVSAAVAYILLEYPDMTSHQIEKRLRDYGIPLNYTGGSIPSSSNNAYGLYVEYITRDLSLDPGVPTFSRESGEFETSFELTLTADEGCTIYYYIGDSDRYLIEYKKPITIKYDTKITAYCYKKGFKKGAWVSRTYTKVFTGDESDFDIDENGTITEYLNDEETVTVPEVLNGITVKAIGKNAFKEKSLSSISLPNTLTSIGVSAFLGCENLELVNAQNITDIQDGAFCNCTSLKYIDISKLKEIKTDVFSGCNSLESIDLSGTESIGMRSFRDCDNLYSCVSDTVCNVSYNAFSDSGVKIIDFPKLTEVGQYTFSECPQLERVNIPNVTLINDRGFYNCVNLKEITLEKVQEIGSYAFYGCKSLERAYLPEFTSLRLARLTESIFYGCSSLKEVIAPKLEKICINCFDYCKELENVYVPELTTIYGSAFDNCGLNYLYVPKLQTTESLPTAENSLIVTSSALESCTFKTPNETLIIQGEKGSYAEEYADEYGIEFADVDAMGGSIRVTDAGLRFGYSFYDTQNKDVEEFGFVYAAGTVDSEELCVENADNHSVYQLIANNRITHDDGLTTFNLVFTNIPEASYGQNVSARAYVKIDDRYLYSDILDLSFKQVANAVLNDDSIDSNTKTAVQNILEKSV